LLLPGDSVVRTINIYPRKPQVWVEPVIAFTVKGIGGFAEGNFRIALGNLQVVNSPSVLTYNLSLQSSAEDVKLAIENTKILGVVNVNRKTLPPCVNGCGYNNEHGDGHTWTITFLNIQVAVPLVKIVNISFIGESSVNSSNLIRQISYAYEEINASVASRSPNASTNNSPPG